MKNQKPNQTKTFCWAFCHSHRSIWLSSDILSSYPATYHISPCSSTHNHDQSTMSLTQLMSSLCYLPCRLAPSKWLDRHISHCMGCTGTCWHTGIAGSSRGHTGLTGSLEGQKCLLEDQCFSCSMAELHWGASLKVHAIEIQTKVSIQGEMQAQ